MAGVSARGTARLTFIEAIAGAAGTPSVARSARGIGPTILAMRFATRSIVGRSLQGVARAMRALVIGQEGGSSMLIEPTRSVSALGAPAIALHRKRPW